MTFSCSLSQPMKRRPVVRHPNGVPGIAPAAARIRSQGSSRCQRAAVPMCVPVMKSMIANGSVTDPALEIELGRRSGSLTVLVLTGITSACDVERLPADQRPDAVVSGVEELCAQLKPPAT
jgi:hypothetical protein